MDNMQKKAINLARNVLFNKCHYDSSYITTDKMFIVWFCKTLQNWKALVSGADVSEYIEVTYDGDKHRAYVDVYAKKTNYCAYDDYEEDENELVGDTYGTDY